MSPSFSKLYFFHSQLALKLLRSKLDNGFLDGYSNLKSIDTSESTLNDVIASRWWDLAHHGGVYTPEHHDAEGLLTYLLVETGCKFWAHVEPQGYRTARNRQEIAKLSMSVMQTSNDSSWQREWEEQEGNAFVIDVQPGDLLYVQYYLFF